MKDQTVACIAQGNRIFSLNDLKPSQLSFINRMFVDDPNNAWIASHMPQLIPLVLCKCEDEYLTYVRRGSEKRLEGKISLTLGGHIELSDYSPHMSIQELLEACAEREVEEETGIVISGYIEFDDRLIYTNEDNVSSVHLGALGILELDSKQELETEEVIPVWKTKEEIKQEFDNLELWSQIIFRYFL